MVPVPMVVVVAVVMVVVMMAVVMVTVVMVAVVVVVTVVMVVVAVVVVVLVGVVLCSWSQRSRRAQVSRRPHRAVRQKCACMVCEGELRGTERCRRWPHLSLGLKSEKC